MVKRRALRRALFGSVNWRAVWARALLSEVGGKRRPGRLKSSGREIGRFLFWWRFAARLKSCPDGRVRKSLRSFGGELSAIGHQRSGRWEESHPRPRHPPAAGLGQPAAFAFSKPAPASFTPLPPVRNGTKDRSPTIPLQTQYTVTLLSGSIVLE